jgi:hypothetical protein
LGVRTTRSTSSTASLTRRPTMYSSVTPRFVTHLYTTASHKLVRGRGSTFQ